MLCIRTREGQLKRLIANPAQRAFEERCGRQNIVLKARQMGITTWVSARFFLRTITTAGNADVAGGAYARGGGVDLCDGAEDVGRTAG